LFMDILWCNGWFKTEFRGPRVLTFGSCIYAYAMQLCVNNRPIGNSIPVTISKDGLMIFPKDLPSPVVIQKMTAYNLQYMYMYAFIAYPVPHCHDNLFWNWHMTYTCIYSYKTLSTRIHKFKYVKGI
jgi:hypothetical protein